MDINKLLKNNAKLYIIMAIIIILGALGITYALTLGNFNAIAVNTTTGTIDANITYDEGTNTSIITNSGNLLPIDDSIVTEAGVDINNPRVLKAQFNVSGVESNPENTIYDIALYASEIDCELRTEDLKWILYKNDVLLSEGNLSPTFDTMAGDRLVLTNTQEDLTTNVDKYTFVLWISEACTGDITECDPSMDQSKYLDKTINASLKVELSTKSKKTLERVTGSELSCNYQEVAVPLCNQLTYNGESQQLINTTNTSVSGISNNKSYKVIPLGVTPISNTGSYTIENNYGTNAGVYAVNLSLKNGYKWSDGSTDIKCIYCSIKKQNLTITTLDQNILYGNEISNTANNISTSGLINGHSLESVSLNANIEEIGTGNISSGNIKIVDSNNNDVTSNYNIKKNNTGTVRIECLNLATEPTITDKEYTGEQQVGVIGGNNIEISGVKSASNTGTYIVTAVPKKNYCWQDKTTAAKEYTWSIIGSELNIVLLDKITNYTGSRITIDKPTITNKDSIEITDIPITYKYYNGNSCSGTLLEKEPTNAGNYSVQAFTEDYQGYIASESNCANLTINMINPEFSLDTTNLSVIYPTKEKISYTYTGDGEVTCNSSSTSVATCSIDKVNKRVIITPITTGTTTITLSAAQGPNYYAPTSKTATVTVTYKTYNITLDNQEATTSGTTTLYGKYGVGIYLDSNHSNNITSTTNAITIPTKVGYTFEGYYTSTNYSKQLINSSGYITSNFTNDLYDSDIILYAKWTSNKYNINYNYNGGTKGPNAPTNVNYNEIINISNPIKEGWTFTGWTFDGETSSAMYGTDESSVTSIWNNNSTYVTAEYFKNLTSVTGVTITMTAHWIKPVTGIFHYYNGSVNATTETQCNLYDTDTTCTFTLPSIVTSSTGPNNAPYYGVSTSTSSTTTTTTYNSLYLNYYTIYEGTLNASYTKENDNVASIGKTSDSCEAYKYYDGSSYISTTCNVTLPDITPASGATVSGWYDESGIKAGNPADIVTLSSNITYVAKANKSLTSSDFSYDNTNTGVECTDVTCMLDELYEKLAGDTPPVESHPQLGDYVSYTPPVTSYKIDTTITDFFESQTIYPNELKLWRVLNINNDGTIDIISEYVSSTQVYFRGQTGYLNFVGYLNVLASQYENSTYTVGSRHFGYNGQTEYITDTSKFTTTAPWTSSTSDNSNEAQGGGDTLYLEDYNKVVEVLGTAVAYNVSATTTAATYWMASRYYNYSDSTNYYWGSRCVNSSGSADDEIRYHYYDDDFSPYSIGRRLRPIVTLKSGLQYTGEGTIGSPWTIVG